MNWYIRAHARVCESASVCVRARVISTIYIYSSFFLVSLSYLFAYLHFPCLSHRKTLRKQIVTFNFVPLFTRFLTTNFKSTRLSTPPLVPPSLTCYGVVCYLSTAAPLNVNAKWRWCLSSVMKINTQHILSLLYGYTAGWLRRTEARITITFNVFHLIKDAWAWHCLKWRLKCSFIWMVFGIKYKLIIND